MSTVVSTGTRYLASLALNTAAGTTQIYTGSGITIGDNRLTTGGLAVTSGTASTNTTTGAFTVAGGVGNNTTGGTWNSGTTAIDFTRNDGVTYSVSLSNIDVNDTYVTGGTVTSGGTLNLFRNDN